MSPSDSLGILIAQLQIQMEGLEALVITSPLDGAFVTKVAVRVAAGLHERGVDTVLYLPGPVPPADPEGPDWRTYSARDVGTPQLARALLASPAKLTVAAAPDVLREPAAVFLAAAADATLLVAERGRTTRSDLKRAALELETAGARLTGAVLRL